MTERTQLPKDTLTRNDAVWLDTIADASTIAQPTGDRYLWPEDVENLRRIAALLKALLTVQLNYKPERIVAVQLMGADKALVIGYPASGQDEETGHNCDAMGCPSAAAHTLYVVRTLTPLNAEQPNDEPMSAFVRRAERYAADYTDLGEGYEREKRMDFFLRGALWMRRLAEQSEDHPCPECGKPMESLLVWRCACGCFGGEQSKDVPEAVESADSPAGVDSGSGSSPRAEAGTSAGTDYDALCEEAEQYGMTLPFNAAGRVVRKLAAAIRELRAEQAKDDELCPRCHVPKNRQIHAPGYSCEYYTDVEGDVAGQIRSAVAEFGDDLETCAKIIGDILGGRDERRTIP